MKLFVIGDSISLHYGPALEAALRGVMDYARKDGVEAALANLDLPQGANGGDSSKVLAYLLAREARGGIAADLLLVNCGLHDIKAQIETGVRQVPIDCYADNLKAIAAAAERMQLKMIWVRTTPSVDAIHNKDGMEFHRYAADVTAYNAVADAIMTGASIPSIDLYTFTGNLGDDIFCDHVHFHDHVRREQGAYIAGWLSAYVARL